MKILWVHKTLLNIVSERSNVGYAEQKLKDALANQILELEEKCKMAEQTRAYFG